MNQTLIARLRSGEIAAENNGSLEQLREVLKAAFPEDQCEVIGDCTYYLKCLFDKGEWLQANVSHLPTVPITDFFEPSTEDRAVELLRELVERWHRSQHINELASAFSIARQFLNELNK